MFAEFSDVLANITNPVFEATSAARVVNGGGGPPLPCPDAGMVHVARVCPGIQAGAAEATRVSSPTFPVSIEVLMNRWPVVLSYVPAGAVTFTVIVQTPFEANVPFENATDVSPVTGTGEKAPEPQPL